MDIINRRLTLREFQEYVETYNFGSAPANKLVIHHTWRPTKETWAGQNSIDGMKGYYEGKGWKVGPHLFIAEDGIWLFTPMRQDGIHTAGLNHCSIGIEVVGDYDKQKWSGQTKINALGAIKILMEYLNLAEKDIFFHRDASTKSCPGWAITKEWLFKELSAFGHDPDPDTLNSLADYIRNSTAPAPVDYYSSPEMVLIPVPDWAQEAVDFVAEHRLFKICCAEDVRHAVRFYRFYNLLRNEKNK
jgi:hypothetical protein